MRIVGVIPARYASSRFPGKPLADIQGKSMIRRVYDQAIQSMHLQDVVVATDDERIYTEVESWNGNVVMTSPDHLNGTERCNEAAQLFSADYICNIQGDEPFINPEQIDRLCEVLDGEVELASMMKKITSSGVLHDHNSVKVVVGTNGDALYFSRQPIPYNRDKDIDNWLNYTDYWKHIGIYAYRKDVLAGIVELPVGQLEASESLEQLRWLAAGYKIRMVETGHESLSVDTPEDLKRLLDRLK